MFAWAFLFIERQKEIQENTFLLCPQKVTQQLLFVTFSNKEYIDQKYTVTQILKSQTMVNYFVKSIKASEIFFCLPCTIGIS